MSTRPGLLIWLTACDSYHKNEHQKNGDNLQGATEGSPTVWHDQLHSVIAQQGRPCSQDWSDQTGETTTAEVPQIFLSFMLWQQSVRKVQLILAHMWQPVIRHAGSMLEQNWQGGQEGFWGQSTPEPRGHGNIPGQRWGHIYTHHT